MLREWLHRSFASITVYSLKYFVARVCFNEASWTFCLQLVRLGNSDYDKRGGKNALTKQGYAYSEVVTSSRTIRETHENITLAHSWLSLNSQPKQSNIRLPFIANVPFVLAYLLIRKQKRFVGYPRKNNYAPGGATIISARSELKNTVARE